MSNKVNPFIGYTKQYYDFNRFLRERFGVKVHKITIDAGLGCPNRDGVISFQGCIYCNKRGSGTGAWENGLPIRAQVLKTRDYLQRRFKAKKFLVYFQSFTNTYAPLETLKHIYYEAIENEDIVGICIGTRPDCIPNPVLEILKDISKRYMVWIEYGLQSFHDKTLLKINRGHTISQFLDAVKRTREGNINICVHAILGLPGETKEDMIITARRLSELDVQGIKIHLLYVIKQTPLADLYLRGEYICLSQEEYIDILLDFLAHLRPDIVIQRLTGDPHPEELLAPAWSLRKHETLRLLQEKMRQENIWQGKRQTCQL